MCSTANDRHLEEEGGGRGEEGGGRREGGGGRREGGEGGIGPGNKARRYTCTCTSGTLLRYKGSRYTFIFLSFNGYYSE